MRTLRRSLLVVSLLTVLGAGLAACGGGRTPTAPASSAQSSTSVSATTSVKSGDGFELTGGLVATTRGPLAVFNDLGCQGCHVAAQTTGKSAIPSLNAVTYFPFSDFALHDMGGALNDGITQGNANGRDWRTAPLWGLGQRLFFLHDGRADTLDQAIAN